MHWPLTPPPWAVSGHSDFMQGFLNIFMKQEKPEMDDFERKEKTLVLKEKYLNSNILRKYFIIHTCH